MKNNISLIPETLKKINNWVCYRTYIKDNKTKKVMISPVTGEFAKSNDPVTWTNFISAYRFMITRKMEGLAFVLDKGITFIDIDHSIDDEGNISIFAKEILNMIPNTYAEKSVSGHGLHILAYASLPENSNKRNDSIGLEMYDTKRFICITGDVLNNRCEILSMQEEINLISKKYLLKTSFQKPKKTVQFLLNYSDEELIKKIRNSKIGNKFDLLFNGDISGYTSHSSADFALVSLLAFWTDDFNQIDSIFRSSGLYREKWDSPRGDLTYGEMTIINAMKMYSHQNIRTNKKNDFYL